MAQRAAKRMSGRTVRVMTGVAAALLAAGAGAALGLPARPVADHTPPHGAGTTTTTTATTTTTTAHTGATTTTPPAPVHTTVALVHYGTCSQVLAGVKAEALSEVGPYGLTTQPVEMFGGVAANASGFAASSPGAGASSGAAAAPAPSANGSNQAAASGTPAYSATNDQEAGVDEPDVAKTDGRLMVVLRHSPLGLQVLDVSGGAAHLDGFVALGPIDYSSELFLDGGYAVVLGSTRWATPQAASGAEPGAQPDEPAGPATEAVVVSLADPSHPSVVRTFDLEGSDVGARLVGGQVLVVLQDQPHMQWATPSDSSAAAQAQATSRNQDLIRNSTLADWLPSVSVAPGGAERTSSCGAALHPDVPSGLDTVSVASLDPSRSQPGPEVTVVGDAATVYASTDTLYVATNPWSVQMEEMAPAPGPGVTPPTLSTDIHAFDISDPTNPVYSGSGTVPGTLIGQYALSEYDGDLRVATTVGLPTPPPAEGTAPAQPSDNIVTVLAPRNGALVPVGSVGGLGRGEKIYGVRFEGPLGYVVTFHQTDPLYVVDLADPTKPVVDGQLGLTGYSSFLQPLSGSLLLGVGSSVDSNLRVTGLQLSVFDVGNPADPVLRSRVELDGASSTAQDDPHALLWWPADRLVAMPVAQSGDNGGGGTTGSGGTESSSGDNNAPFDGVIVWHVGSDGTLTEVARLSQPQPRSQEPPCDTCGSAPPAQPGNAPTAGAPASGPMIPAGGGGAMYYPYPGGGIERAIAVGNLLYTVSDAGVMANSMSNWSQMDWLAFSGS